MVALLGLAALVLLLLFARSGRVAFSGPISTVMGASQIPTGIATLWLLSLYLGWWTVAAFVGASLIAGIVIRRDNLDAWINLQPITGAAHLGLVACGWALHLLR